MFEAGTELGAYRVRSRIGEGGLSAVYEVVHGTLGSRHALKVLEVASPEARARMLHEGRTQARVRHPNLVGVTDVIPIGDRPALVLEYVDGPTLEGFLERGLPPLDVALGLFRGIVRGVEAAHAADLVHRDLKPSNVLVATSEGGALVPKVADFGLARALDETETDAARDAAGRGTPNYMAPEQHRGRGVDERADLFALGCILYELVTGARAFDGDDVIAIGAAACERRYRAPQELVPELPAEVVATIHALLEPLPERRLQSCAAALAALDGQHVPSRGTPSGETLSLEELPAPLAAALQARRPPRPAPSLPPTRSSRIGPAVVALTGLALVAVVAVALALPSVVPRRVEALAPSTGTILPVVAPPLPVPVPVPVPVTVPGPVPAPVPVAAPAPAWASVTVAGDAAVQLFGPDGAATSPGRLRPGTWRYRASFGETEATGEILLAPGDRVTVTCSTFAQRCRITR